MSDKIRIDLTRDESNDLVTFLQAYAGDGWASRHNPVWPLLAKIFAAQKNPLNGPTFPAVAGK